MFCQIFLSLHVKKSLIISNKLVYKSCLTSFQTTFDLCDKSCDVGEYLDYTNCKCRKKLVDKLVEECTENIDDVKIGEMAFVDRRNDSS